MPPYIQDYLTPHRLVVDIGARDARQFQNLNRDFLGKYLPPRNNINTVEILKKLPFPYFQKHVETLLWGHFDP